MTTASGGAQALLVTAIACLFAWLALSLVAETVAGFELPDTTPTAETEEQTR